MVRLEKLLKLWKLDEFNKNILFYQKNQDFIFSFRVFSNFVIKIFQLLKCRIALFKLLRKLSLLLD